MANITWSKIIMTTVHVSLHFFFSEVTIKYIDLEMGVVGSDDSMAKLFLLSLLQFPDPWSRVGGNAERFEHHQ